MKHMSVMIFICIILCVAFLFYPDYAKKYHEIIRLNSSSNNNFRISGHNASGSSQFTEAELQKILNQIGPKKIWIVDLREESHAFLNGDPISWYRQKNWLNRGKTETEILADEQSKINDLSKKPLALLYKKKESIPHFYLVNDISTSEEMARKHGAEYVRFPTSDYSHPNNQVVDHFINFAKNLPQEDWLHFHCSAGRGRTSVFLTIFEIMKNPSHKTLEEITAEQESLGGLDLLKKPIKNSWKYPYSLARKQFIVDFHQYVKENPDFSVSWSDWKMKKNIG